MIQSEHFAKYDRSQSSGGKGWPAVTLSGNVTDERGSGMETFGDASLDVLLNLLRSLTPAMDNDASEPLCEVGGRWAAAAEAGQIKVGVSVDKSGNDGDVAQIDISGSIAMWFRARPACHLV